MDDENIKPIDGLNGDVNIVLQEQTNAEVQPQDAITSDSTVILKTDQGYSVKKVTTGIESDTDVEIKMGLNEFDQVVLNPNDFLKTHPNIK
jgi:multidrug efflux pump subunit AcrA (membrane-fusion protein)